jgi:uncharacterized membrane protein YgdD (TMEM256/DUF423 family)
MRARDWIGIGAVLAATGVAAGAFGAHGLEGRVAPDLLEIWRTAAHYHLVHAVGLVMVAFAVDRGVRGATVAGWLLVGGVAVFSGSLYLLTLTGLRGLGAITPIGGVALIAGWITLAVGAWRGER